MNFRRTGHRDSRRLATPLDAAPVWTVARRARRRRGGAVRGEAEPATPSGAPYGRVARLGAASRGAPIPRRTAHAPGIGRTLRTGPPLGPQCCVRVAALLRTMNSLCWQSGTWRPGNPGLLAKAQALPDRPPPPRGPGKSRDGPELRSRYALPSFRAGADRLILMVAAVSPCLSSRSRRRWGSA